MNSESANRAALIDEINNKYGTTLENLEDGDRVRITQSAIVLEKVIGQFLYGKMSEKNAD